MTSIITDYPSNVISQLGSAGTFYHTQTGCNIELNWLITSGYIQSIDKLFIFRSFKFATRIMQQSLLPSSSVEHRQHDSTTFSKFENERLNDACNSSALQQCCNRVSLRDTSVTHARSIRTSATKLWSRSVNTWAHV